MTDTHFDLLHQPWFSVLDAGGQLERLDLGEVLARLGSGEDLEFPSLQAHQEQAWYAFLVQLAALALDRQDDRALDREATGWQQLVGKLHEDPATWCLVVDDLARPAFFQSPVPEGNLQGFKRRSASPEILDVLIAAKNHDIKADRFSAPPEPEHWAYALVTLQTMEGFLGRGNYGIARMNGGFASRPEVALAADLRWPSRFRRDVQVLLEHESLVVGENEYDPEGLRLLWTLPWKGGKGESLGTRRLHPFFLEVCRRVRLVMADGTVEACLTPTEGSRVDAKEQMGNLGDAWTPIRKKDQAALTVSDRGFHYRLVQQLLFGDEYAISPALELRSDDSSSPVAVFRALARGQGKTGGFHQRQIPIPPKVRRRFGQADERAQLGLESKSRIEKTATAQRMVLRLALLTLLQERVEAPAGHGLNFKDERAKPWLDRFDREVDRVFFDELFRDLEQEPVVEARNARWDARLYHLLRPIFEEAIQTLAPAGVHRYRAIAKARSLFEVRARHDLPGAFPDRATEPPTESQPSSSMEEPRA